MAMLLAGKPVIAQMNEAARARVDALAARDIEPCLALVRVGERPDDVAYERSVMRRAEIVGVRTVQRVLPADATFGQVSDAIRAINADKSIHGCLMFRPLPAHIDDAAVCALLDPAKDADGITPTSLASVFMDGEGFAPSTAAACVRMLDGYGIDPAGKHVVVVGRSMVVGKPLACLLLHRNATVTVCHSRTADLSAVMRSADIVVCATGRARAYGADCFAPGQIVLDVGINFTPDGTMCGDVDFEAVEPIVSAITPVPGGIGGLTCGITLEHVLFAAERL